MVWLVVIFFLFCFEGFWGGLGFFCGVVLFLWGFFVCLTFLFFHFLKNLWSYKVLNNSSYARLD